MRKYFPLIVLISTLVALLVDCTPIPNVPIPPTDDTPPLLRMGSAGLKKDILLTQSSTEAEQRRAKRTDEILLLASAEDPESGIKSVTLDVTLSVTCGQTGTNQTFSETQYAPSDTGTLPTQLSKSYVFKVAPERAKCRNNPSSVTLSIIASAENGIGKTTQLYPARISSFGPDELRVATFNLSGPQPDSTYQRWGQQLGAKADVWILTEVIDQRTAELLATAAGMAYVVKMDGWDVAVASRTPLYNVQTHVIDPPGSFIYRNSRPSKILSVQTEIDGLQFQFIGTHWGIHDTNDVPMGPEASSPSRLEAAHKIADMVLSSSAQVFVAGDMNAFSGSGPQDHDDNPTTSDFVGSTSEVDFLRTLFDDPFITLALPNTSHCSNKRIDYIMTRGSYAPIKYDACFQDAPSPSDHPFVLVTFEVGD